MNNRLLIYRWGSLNEEMLCRTMKKLNIDYIEFTQKMSNYHADAAFAKALMDIVHAKKIQSIFSYDYFPLIAMICEINKIPYISWIYDCPLYTLLSKTIISKYNYIFCFDRMYTERLRSYGAVNCYHLPLAGEKENIKKIEKLQKICQKNYECDISFVGNLYNEKRNRLRQVKLEPYITGYVEGLIQAQLKVYGYNFLKEALTEELCKEIVDKCELRLGNEYIQDDRQMAADALGMEVTGREREKVICEIANYYPITLYTSSELPETLQISKVEKMGYADYETEVPLIFHESKINLNITSKTIESGIPQRIFDVLSCGGFCLTNYQPEVAENFVDGEDLVMYSSIEDLISKVDYYLKHEKERKQIAANGYSKVVKYFGMEVSIATIMKVANTGKK